MNYEVLKLLFSLEVYFSEYWSLNEKILGLKSGNFRLRPFIMDNKSNVA
jgi:hypothetical protein